MASGGLPPGAFLTTINGRRCTAIPKRTAAALNGNKSTPVTTSSSLVQTTSTSTSSSLVETTTTSSSFVRTTPTFSSFVQTTPNPTTALVSVPAAGAAASSAALELSSTTATTANVLASSSSTTLAQVPAPPALAIGPAATPLLTTIESPQTTTDSAVSGATGSAAGVVQPASSTAQSTAAVAGGVIGGAVAISVLAFFIWWWRRPLFRRRRSTLLTPLDAAPSADRDEKGGYVITRGSIGPTPTTEKLKAALGQNWKKVRGHIRNRTEPSVDLDRGPSQFVDPARTRHRANSELTLKDRVKDWWFRTATDMKYNSRLRNRTSGRPVPGNAPEKEAAVGSQPDFLTLLSMDNGELDREAQRRRASSTGNFLDVLNLNFSSSSPDNPFSDANAVARTSAAPAPLAVGQPKNSANPFSDANAIREPPSAMPKASTYVANIRRSRGHSVSNSISRPPSSAYYSRDSVGSVGSIATATTNYRNKFRSDPFDLERPELLGAVPKTPVLPPRFANGPTTTNSNLPDRGRPPSTGSHAADPRRPSISESVLRPPAAARPRAESLTSSKYSSGVSASEFSVSSMGDWSDPGPDVGPAASRWPAEERLMRGSPTQGWRDRLERERAAGRRGTDDGGSRASGGSWGSLGSVGKAM